MTNINTEYLINPTKNSVPSNYLTECIDSKRQKASIIQIVKNICNDEDLTNLIINDHSFSQTDETVTYNHDSYTASFECDAALSGEHDINISCRY